MQIMTNGDTSPYNFCKILHNIIAVTLENVIIPLRKEAKHIGRSAEILSLETELIDLLIQDAENKTFECLAQQIFTICNAVEDVAKAILEVYPKSEACFKCLGINEDTIQLLDMPDEEISGILHNYGDSTSEIEHVLAALAKIRGNIALIENEAEFDDDTRSFIKLVSRLTEELNDDLHSVHTSPKAKEAIYSNNKELDSPRIISCDCKSSLCTPYCSAKDLHVCDPYTDDSTLGICASSVPNYPVKSFPSTRADKTFCGRVTLSSKATAGNNIGSINGFRSFGHNTSPTSFCYPSDIISQLTDSGVSVPSTPVWFGKATYGQLLHPSSVHNCERMVTTAENTPPQSPRGKRSQPIPVTHFHRERQPIALSSKNRLKAMFPLHRSKSHESNLANRLGTPACIDHSGHPSCRDMTGCPHYVTPDVYTAGSSDAIHTYDVGSHSPTSLRCKLPNSPFPSVKVSHYGGCSCPHRNDGSINAKSLNSFCTHGSETRLISCDDRSPKTALQLPTLMTTSVDGGSCSALINFPRSTGTLLNQNNNGYTHRFETKFLWVRRPLCAICSQRTQIRLLYCVNCKIKVHKSCATQAYEFPCTACVPCNELYDTKGSPDTSRKALLNTHSLTTTPVLRPIHSTPIFQGTESNSASSCASSAPGSPFVAVTSLFNHHAPIGDFTSLTSPPPQSHSTGHNTILNQTFSHGQQTNFGSSLGHTAIGRLPSPCSTHSFSSVGHAYSPHRLTCYPNQFDFPVSSIEDGTYTGADDSSVGTNPLISTQSSAESEQTVINGLPRGLVSMDSQDESSNLARANSVSKLHVCDRLLISVTLKEWDIPMENLAIGDLIGRGTFGSVYRAKWHGEVAVKRIELDPEDRDGSARLESFKHEVALLHKTRHENLVLFMGACMKPPDLAIVTQFIQGETLYNLLHHRGTHMTINRTMNIASQISKGMGYLHAKGIVHRDLKTRNIFLEPNSRVVIGDFGVFSCVRFYRKAKFGNYLNVPPFWLCYMAPEVIHALRLNMTDDSTTAELPLTPSSDVFAFGTVWYELLMKEFPYKGYSAESIIYLGGRGIEPTLRIPGPKDFKEILVQCWSFCPSKRPGFTKLVKLLDRLPKLHRSPSYPVKPLSDNHSGSHDNLLR